MFFKSKSEKASADFIARLKTAPVVQEALREIESQDLADRKALIEEMDAVDASVRAFMTMRVDRESKIDAEIRALERRRTELGEELIDLAAAGSRMRSSANRERHGIVAQIKAGADPRINNFVLWAQHAHDLARVEAWHNSPSAKLYMVEAGAEDRVARTTQLAQESFKRLGELVKQGVARADVMRLEAALPDDVMLQLESMAAAIHGEYVSQAHAQPLSKDFLARIPGVMVVEINDMSEAA